VLSDRLHENRTASTAIRYEPTPEVCTFARSPEYTPSAAQEREVQKNDRVRRSKPNLDNVIGTEVTIHDPTIFRNELLLHDRPPIARSCNKTLLPKDLIKLDDREPGDLAPGASRESICQTLHDP